MKALKILLIIVVVLVAVPLIAALFVGKTYQVEREVVIEQSRAEVFDYVKYLKNQDYYSVWSMRDPDMKKTFEGTDGTVGFVAGWESSNDEVGVGEQEILAIDEGKRIDYELRFMKPFEASDKAYMLFEDAGPGATKVKWGFDGDMDYPMNLLLVLMDFEEMLGADLQQGLDNLKKQLES